MVSYSDVCAELYKRGNYTFQVKTPWGIHEKQKTALELLNDKTTSQVGYGGSGRSGKSWIASEWLLMQCLSYEGLGYGLARRELKNLKRTTLRTLFKVFFKYRLVLGVDYKYNQQDQVITFPKTGSEIFLIETAFYPSDPLYMRFGGYELTGVVIDESAETDYKAIEILFGRCGFRKNIEYGIPPKMLEMFNPDKGHVYTRYYEPYKHNREKPNRKFIPALPKDNPDPAVKVWIEEQLLNSSEITIQRLVNGDFDYDESKDRLINHDSLNNMFLNEHVKPTGIKYITADIARMGSDATIILIWDGFVVTHRYILNKSDIANTAKYIRDLATTNSVVMSHTIVDEDGVGCLVKGTLVLTKNGWSPVEEIKTGDIVYSKDLDDNLIEAKVSSNIKREKTDIIEDQSGISFSFSHFLPRRTRPEYPSKLDSWDSLSKGGKIFLDTVYNWIGEDFVFRSKETSYTMPNGGIKTIDNGLNIDSKTFASFIGWFVSEGCIDGKYIRITQNQNSPYYQEIKGVLVACGFVFYEKLQNNKRAVDFIFSNKNLVIWLKSNCYTNQEYKSYNKKIPDLIKWSTKEVINSFLQSFCHGDGHYHKGERMYSTGSEQLSYDLHECVIKIGRLATRHLKNKKGSIGMIDGRVLTRKRQSYLIAELKEKTTGLTPSIAKIYEDHVYNLEIDSPTRLYMVMFDKYKKPFFVHNGGVKDILKCHGFVANKTPLGKTNFGNLKAQASFTMARLINEDKVYYSIKTPEIIQKVKQEADWVKQKDIDKDGKLYIIPKDVVKANIGRSPDDMDAICMRAYFVLGQKVG